MVTASEENIDYICNDCVGGWGPINIAVDNLDLGWVPDEQGIEHLVYQALLSVWSDGNTAQQIWAHEGQEIIYNGYRIKFLRVDVVEEPGLGSKEYAVFFFAYETETNQ